MNNILEEVTEVKRETFYCSDADAEHQFSIVIEDLGLSEVKKEILIVSVSLCHGLPFFTRMVLAARYIFGYRSRYGMFAEILIGQGDKQRLLEIINRWGDGV